MSKIRARINIRPFATDAAELNLKETAAENGGCRNNLPDKRRTAISVLRTRLLAICSLRSLRLHILNQRVHVLSPQTQPRHRNFLILLEQRRRDRILLRDQLVRLRNNPHQPRAIAHTRDAKQIWSNLVAVADRVTRRATRRKQILPFVEI